MRLRRVGAVVGVLGARGQGQGLEASESLEEEAGPEVVGLVAQDDAAGVAGDEGGDVHRSQADRPGRWLDRKSVV